MLMDQFAYNHQDRHPEHELDGATATEPPETPVRRTHPPLPNLPTSTPHISFPPVAQAHYTPTPAYLWAPHGSYQYLYSSPGPSIPQPLYYLPTQVPSQLPPVESSNIYLQNQRGKDEEDTLKEEKRAWRTAQAKVEEVLELLKSFKWTLGDFLYHTFAMVDTNKKPFCPTDGHSQMVSKFLAGETKIPAIQIIQLWLDASYSLPPAGHEEQQFMFSTNKDYHEIKYARPAITSAMAQLVKEKVVKEARKVVKKSSGLHTFTTRNNQVAKYDGRAETFSTAKTIFQELAPLLWSYFCALASPHKESLDRDRRPPEIVVTHALSALFYSRNMYAKLVPLDKGILNFACCANHYVYKYDSRVGAGPSYHSVYNALKKLAEHDSQIIKEVTRSGTSLWILRFDNVQHYIRPRHIRVGREATMKIGTAGTVFGFHGYSPAVVSIATKQQYLSRNSRKKLTFDGLMDMIDTEHIDRVCALQWVRVLVNYVPHLQKYKKEVNDEYKASVAKRPLIPRQTQIYPLPTNGRNETVTADLLKAVIDFIQEMGYSEDEPIKHLIFAGGDGLTYERMVLLKLYLQFHDTSFQRLEWLQPFLETWHTCWTDLSRIYEAHWDSLLSADPSSIGNNANHLKRKAPSNVKKVDYYPYSELAYQVLDARILDCWRIHLGGKDANLLEHFEKMDEKKSIPLFAKLLEDAHALFKKYGHPHAFEDALEGTYNDVATQVPDGDPWVPATQEQTSAVLESNKKKGNNKGGKKNQKHNAPDTEEVTPFHGDLTLAQSCRFLYDATVSREVVFATADGDVGRVWEILKAMILTFAGSSHPKYLNYLLEMLCDLELESSRDLRNAFLDNWIINPSGKPGAFIAGDKFQEQLQDEMYEHIGRKDRGFDEDYMRKVIAPNAHRFVLVKKSVTEGLGLARRSGKHIEPHTNPETAKLLQVYQTHQLHLFRKGRTYGGDPRKVDDLGRGVQRLIEGKLASWVNETTRARNLTAHLSDLHPADLTEDETSVETFAMDIARLDEEAAQHAAEEQTRDQTEGEVISTVDGELIFEYGEQLEEENLEENPNEFEESNELEDEDPLLNND